MERIQISANFYLDEYIPKDLYLKTPDPNTLLSLLNPELIISDQLLRDHFGPVTINDWWHGGLRTWSGWRPEDCIIGAKGSDHKKGMASDKLFQKVDSDTVRIYIRENWHTLGLNKLEEFLIK